MSGTLYSVVYIATFLVAFVSVGAAVYQGARLIGEVRKERRMVANLIAPLILIVPGILTDKGNVHRVRFVIFLLVAGAAVFSLYQMELNYGKRPYIAG